jgi:hypothetical protein
MINNVSKARKLEAYLDIKNDISRLGIGDGTLFYGGIYVERKCPPDQNGDLFWLSNDQAFSNEHGIFFSAESLHMTKIPEITAIVFRHWLGYIAKWGILE